MVFPADRMVQSCGNSSLLRLCETFFYWVAVGFLLLLLPARFFLTLRVLTKPEVAAGVVALCIAPLLRRRPVPPWASAALILMALMIRGLAPFEFSAFAAPFSWVPFSGLLNADWQSALLILITEIVLVCRRCVGGAAMRGFGLGCVGVAVAVVLAGIEIVQRHMPAHVPEITDPLLALGCAAVFRLVVQVPLELQVDGHYSLQQR